MFTDPGIKTLEDYTRELRFKVESYGHSHEFVDWLNREFEKLRPELKNWTPLGREYEILSYTEWLLSTIEEEQPSDPRAFAERTIRKMHLDRDFFELTDGINKIEPGDIENSRILTDAVLRFLERAEREFPGFTKEKDRLLSRFRQGILEIRKTPSEERPINIYKEKRRRTRRQAPEPLGLRRVKTSN